MTPIASFPLLRTKLNRPAVAGAVIARPRLLQKLTPAIERKLTLVSAPAGFGKTTVLVQWLADVSLPSAWISLDEHDNDLNKFLAYVVEALRSLFPDACPDTFRLVHAPRDIPLTHVAYTLINEIAVLPGAFVLVLDDYHVVRAQAIHHLLTTLISFAPANLHLVLSTRADPPLPLARLRARQELVEVRAADLRFRSPEIEAFLTETMALGLDAQERAILEQETEGWAAGIQLAALSLREAGDTRRLLDELARGEHGHVMDFLVSEVLESSEPGTLEFLQWTSLFERFSPALCDAVQIVAAPYQGAAELIAAIEHANLFVVRLDNAGKWFRYHHLFRSLLRLRLSDHVSPEAIAAMHRRASAWFAAEGWVDEALEHALAAEDLSFAAEIVEEYTPNRFNVEDWRAVERWLGRLPEELVQQRPALLLARAWTLVIRTQFEGLPALLDTVEAQLAGTAQDGTHILEAELWALRAAMLADDRVQDDVGSRALALRALEALPKDNLLPRRFAMVYFARADQRLGRGEESVAVLSKLLESEGTALNTFTGGVAVTLGQVYAEQGDLDGMARVVSRMLVQDRRSSLVLSSVAAALVRAAYLYFRCRLPEAQTVLEQALHTPYGGRPAIVLQAGYLLALVYEMQGDSARSEEQMGTLSAYLAQDGNAALHHLYESFRARLNLMRGNLDAAVQWARQVSPSPRRINHDDVESPSLIYVAIRLAQSTPASLGEAHALLRELDEEMARIHFVRRRVQVCVLLALAHAAQGNEAASLLALRQAVELARQGRIVVYFVEQGDPIRKLLQRFGAQAPEDDFLCELLAAFPVPIAKRAAKAIVGPSQEGLIEDLTVRETEILRLLEQGWSNAEIAGALVLSPLTVKRHIANVYQKLGVNNRTRAVRRGRELGVLPPA